MLTPEFGTSAFPMCSARPSEVSTTFTSKRHKRVRFSSKLTDEYEIASRQCRQGLSTSTEKLLNEVQRLKKEILSTRETINEQSLIEANLFDHHEALSHKYASSMTILQFRKSIETLELRLTTLEDETFSMRMETLRIKGLHKQLLDDVEKRKKLLDDRANTSCLPFFFAQTMWSAAAGHPKSPVPLAA
jgi:hypothetical protein